MRSAQNWSNPSDPEQDGRPASWIPGIGDDENPGTNRQAYDSAASAANQNNIWQVGAHNFLDPSFIYAMKEEKYSKLVDNTLPQNMPEDAKDFYSRIKFMTFKIKQKSHKDYHTYRGEQISLLIYLKSHVNFCCFDNRKIIVGPVIAKHIF